MTDDDIVISFQISDTGTRSDFKDFLKNFVEEDLNQTFSGSVNDDQLEEIKRKAGSVEFRGDDPSDGIVIYENSTLGIETFTY